VCSFQRGEVGWVLRLFGGGVLSKQNVFLFGVRGGGTEVAIEASFIRGKGKNIRRPRFSGEEGEHRGCCYSQIGLWCLRR